MQMFENRYMKKLVLFASKWGGKLVLLLAPAVAVATGGPVPPPSAAASKFKEVIDNVINFGLGLLVVLAVAMIVYVAFLFLTAGGNSETFQKARTYLLYILVAVAVGLLARVFVALVFELAGEPIPDSL
jgi:Na+-driven multidrug efflux pump